MFVQRLVIFMKESGLGRIRMGSGTRLGAKMEAVMKGSGLMVNLMALASILKAMEMLLKGSGDMEKLMVLLLILRKVRIKDKSEISIRVNGKKERSMGKELSFGQMEPNFKGFIKMIKNMVKELYILLMAHNIQESLEKELLKAQDPISGPTGNSIKDNG
jgi:hypothetical protein